MSTTTSRGTSLILLVLAALWLVPSRADDPPPDDEDRQYERELSERVWRENCLMCHSAEMTTNQRMTPAAWQAEVEKMIGWGAPVPPEDQPRLVAYLAEHFGPARPNSRPARITREEIRDFKRPGGPVKPLGDPKQGPTLYATHCAGCHGEDARGGDLGTNLVAYPVLLDADRFSEVVQQGRHRMPGFTEVLDTDKILDVLAWLREFRYPAVE